MKDKIRKAADKSKSYSQFAEAEYPKRCRNTKRRVQKRTSVRSWKWRIKHSVIRKKNLKEFRREDRLPEYLRAEDCEVHPYSGSPRRTLRPGRHNVSPAKSGTRTPR